MAQLPTVDYNLDIFDPKLTQYWWESAATQQQINVFLYQQLSILKQKHIKAIQDLNTLNTKVAGEISDLQTLTNSHDEAIKNIDAQLLVLQSEQTKIRSEWVDYKSAIDSSITLFQTNINNLSQNVTKLTTSTEKLHSDVEEIRTLIDVDKLNEVIRMYQDVLDTLDSKIETKLEPLIDEIATQTADIATLRTEFTTHKSDVNALIAAAKSELQTSITSVQTEFNTYKIQMNAKYLEVSNWMDEFEKSVQTRFTALTNTVTKNDTDTKSRETALVAQLREEIQSGDNRLQSALSELRAEYEQYHDDNEVSIASIRKTLGELSASDEKQWTTINNLLANSAQILEQHNILTSKYEVLNNDFTTFKTEQTGKNQSFTADIATNSADIQTLKDRASSIEGTAVVKSIYSVQSLAYPTTVNATTELIMFGKKFVATLINTTTLKLEIVSGDTMQVGTVLYSLNRAKWSETLANFPHTVSTNRQYIEIRITDLNEIKAITFFVETRNSALRIFGSNLIK